MAKDDENKNQGDLTGGLSALDLFTQETLEEEENLLVKTLPELDIYELLEDCKAMLAELNHACKIRND